MKRKPEAGAESLCWRRLLADKFAQPQTPGQRDALRNWDASQAHFRPLGILIRAMRKRSRESALADVIARAADIGTTSIESQRI
jgi:hypothetical protein